MNFQEKKNMIENKFERSDQAKIRYKIFKQFKKRAILMSIH
jgi:hypothetical protein